MHRRPSWPRASKCCGGALLILAGVAFGSIAVLIHATSHCFRQSRLFILSSSAHWSAFPLTFFSCDIVIPRKWRRMQHRRLWPSCSAPPLPGEFDHAHVSRRGIDYWVGGGCNYGATNDTQDSDHRPDRSARLRKMKTANPSDGPKDPQLRHASRAEETIEVVERNWRAEVETAQAYRDLAARELDEKRKGILIRMAEAEERHAATLGKKTSRSRRRTAGSRKYTSSPS